MTTHTDSELELKGTTALILEGGSFRGQFTAGVLDVLMENDLNFDVCYGVSAGALNGLNFKSRQIGRANRVNLTFCNDQRYIGARSFLTSGSMIGYDFLLNDVQDRYDPFDAMSFMHNPLRLFAGVTNVLFGTPEYFEVKNPTLDLDVVRASTSLPLLTHPVRMEGMEYLDGGIADSVPVEHVLNDVGCSRAVIVLTRERSYQKSPYETMGPARRVYARYPYLLEALETRHARYNKQRTHIWEAEAQGRAFIFAPQRPVEVAHIERDALKLLDLYLQGRQEALRLLSDLKAFLA